MDKISDISGRIHIPDRALTEKARARLDSLTKPAGSLGRLEELAARIVSITGKERPTLAGKVIFTVAADHGVTDEGVSCYPKAVTAQMVYNFMRGGAAINVLARHAGARVVVADVGVAEDMKPGPGLIIKKIGRGTKNMARGPAMSRDDAIRAVTAGIEMFESEAANGIDITGTGDMGIGNTTASSAITAVFTGAAAEDITGRGTGIDDKALAQKVEVVKKAIALNRPDPEDAIDVLSKVGGFEIGALAGIMLASAAGKVPVVIDGFISGAAALVAYHIHPPVKEYMIASHLSVEKGHATALDHLGLKPILDLDMRLGEGTGAALGIMVADAATKILNEMATFKEASVSERASG
jgi:nicotinate-nucleotide--dimethylbenzimidazole phosphoribosyltransferase